MLKHQETQGRNSRARLACGGKVQTLSTSTHTHAESTDCGVRSGLETDNLGPVLVPPTDNHSGDAENVASPR